MVKKNRTKQSSQTIVKALPVKGTPYVEEMKIWLDERELIATSCLDAKASHRREIAHLRSRMLFIEREIRLRRKGIILENQQLRATRWAIRDGKKDLRHYLKGKAR